MISTNNKKTVCSTPDERITFFFDGAMTTIDYLQPWINISIAPKRDHIIMSRIFCQYKTASSIFSLSHGNVKKQECFAFKFVYFYESANHLGHILLDPQRSTDRSLRNIALIRQWLLITANRKQIVVFLLWLTSKKKQHSIFLINKIICEAQTSTFIIQTNLEMFLKLFLLWIELQTSSCT